MNTAIVVVVTLVVFVGVMMIGSLAWASYQSNQKARSSRLSRRLGTLTELPEESLFRLDSGDPLGARMGSVGRDLEALLVQAGSPYDVRSLFLRMSLFATVGVLVLGLVLKGPMAVFGVALGVIPPLLLSRMSARRAKALSEQLPDALDLVSRSLQAGHGLSDAMRLCAQEMPMPVAHEFGRVFDEHNLGRDLRESLTALSVRNPRNFDLKIFVSSVLLQRDTGGNLIEILDNIANTIRDRFVFKAKVKALTAEARISAIILGSLPIIMLALIGFMRGEYLAPLWQDPLGHAFLVFGGGLYLIGILVMRLMSQVET
jgi:tight adherence protein B